MWPKCNTCFQRGCAVSNAHTASTLNHSTPIQRVMPTCFPQQLERVGSPIFENESNRCVCFFLRFRVRKFNCGGVAAVERCGQFWSRSCRCGTLIAPAGSILAEQQRWNGVDKFTAGLQVCLFKKRSDKLAMLL